MAQIRSDRESDFHIGGRTGIPVLYSDRGRAGFYDTWETARHVFGEEYMMAELDNHYRE